MDKILNYTKQTWRHTGFQKYFRNTGWMFSARIIGFITSFFTVAIVARYLGPENLGKFEYAQSFVAIISVFASLGIDQILFRDLASEPNKQNELIGTAVYSKLFFGALALIISILISILLGDELLLTALIGISALSFVVAPIGTVGILFHSQVKSKYSSQIAIFLAFFIPGLKILVIFFDKGILYFAAILLVEALVSVAWSIYIYITKFNGNPLSWSFNLEIFKRLLKDSWPLLFASLSGYIYAKMDQVMLLHYLDPKSVGIYSVAVKLTQVWSFLPGLIIGSLFPAIINAKKESFISYSKRFKSLSLLTLGITTIVALPLYIFASFVINLVFGSEFSSATPILQIYLWISIAITMTSLAYHFLIVENLSKIFLYISLTGAVINIILNVLLIPIYGIHGAAFATLISYFAAVLSVLLFKKSRNGVFGIIKNNG